MTSQTTRSRWIQDLDVQVGMWIALAAVGCGMAYVLMTWDRPHRLAMLVLLAACTPAAFIKPKMEIGGSAARAEAVTIASSVLFLGVITAMCALDGGASSPVRMFFFASVAYATLAYPIKPATGIVASAIACYLALAIAGSEAAASALAMIVALACVGAVGVRCTRREAQRRSELAVRESRIRHLSLYDTLTGLPNRTLLLDRLAHALVRTRREGGLLAVMFLDVDNFKTVNDAYGHALGDELLRSLTTRLERKLGAADTLARFGGDKFVMLCEDLAGPGEVQARAESILGAFTAPFLLGPGGAERTEHHASASVGIAIAGPGTKEDPCALLRDADTAMHRAKTARGQVEFFDQVSRARVLHRVHTGNELREALDSEQLRVAYQPIVSLRDGSVRKMEALLRWRHPQRGFVSPADFIPVAEESGLILAISEQVLDQVCRQLTRWDAAADRRMHGLQVAVNISARQLIEPSLPAQLGATLDAHGLSAGRIACEITETALIDDPARASATVDALADTGLDISLDDFCTGYSALVHLKRFPLTSIKLDRTFIAGVPSATADTAVVRGLVEIAEAMGLTTVAEGIETHAQLNVLRQLGCHHGQGYLFSPALAPDDLAALVCARPEGRFDLAVRADAA